jgi:hypothetical protein
MRLPEQFTMDDLRAMKGKTYPDGTLRQTISRWRKDGWIEKTARGNMAEDSFIMPHLN